MSTGAEGIVEVAPRRETLEDLFIQRALPDAQA